MIDACCAISNRLRAISIKPLSRPKGINMRIYYWAVVLAASATVATSAMAMSYYTDQTDFDEPSFHVRNLSPTSIRETKVRQTIETKSKRTETIKYNSWVLVCRFFSGTTTKKNCIASLRVVADNEQRPLLVWQIGLDKDGHFVNTFHVPSLLVIRQAGKAVRRPLLVQSGMDLKFGNGSPKRINYLWCGPKQCVAEALIDDVFAREAASNTNATITLRTGFGEVVPIEVSIRGIEKAISATKN